MGFHLNLTFLLFAFFTANSLSGSIKVSQHIIFAWKHQITLLTSDSSLHKLLKSLRTYYMGFFSRLTTVKMDLESLIYISYLVPVERIRSFVPPVLPIASNDEEQAYVSFVAMKCRRVRLSGICWPSFNYDQLNLRTYVTDPHTGVPAVYFLNSGVSLVIIPIITRLITIPWEKVIFNLYPISDTTYRASGNWLGEINFEIKTQADHAPKKSVVQHLTGPMIGFIGTESKLRKFRINHRSLEVKPAVLTSISFSLPVEKGLLTKNELQGPASVLMVPKAEFIVYLPPHRVTERG